MKTPIFELKHIKFQDGLAVDFVEISHDEKLIRYALRQMAEEQKRMLDSHVRTVLSANPNANPMELGIEARIQLNRLYDLINKKKITVEEST